MKKTTLFILILFFSRAIAQNTGIGTSNPLATLDIRGNQRLGGLDRYSTYDSVSGRIAWVKSNLFVPAPQYLIKHSASAEGLYYGNGKLLYRGIADTAFYTDWINGNGYFKGLVGLGTTNPAVKLDIRGINGWELQYGEGDMRIGNDTYRLKVGVALEGGGAGAANIMQYGDAAGYNALSLGSQGNYLLTLNGNNKVVEIAQDGGSSVGIGTAAPSEKLEVSGGIKAGGYKYLVPKTLYYSIPESGFTARYANEQVYKATGDHGGAYMQNGLNWGLIAAVNLPHNARLISMKVDFYDTSPAIDLRAYFTIQGPNAYGFGENITSTGSAGLNTQTLTFNPSLVIDNSANAYEVIVAPINGFWIDSNLAIRRLIFQYTLAEAQ